ncbi:MAG: DUF692 family protein [Archangium sp.]
MFGVGLRPKHYSAFLNGTPKVDFVEAIAENFMGVGGRPVAVLEKARADRPVFLHGVSLGIASVAPLDERYLTAWKQLIERVQPTLVSDHLCWGRAHGNRYSHDLLPVPFTTEALEHVVSRVQQVQDFLGRQLVLENVSSYLTFTASEFTEWDFLSQLAQRSGCGVLLDVNNVFVSSRNHGFDPDAFLAAMPVESVKQFHLAGHQRRPEVIIDTHDGPVSDEVWALYARARGRFTNVPTLIEWDDQVPELDVLLAEAEKARAIVPMVLEPNSLSLRTRGEGQGEGLARAQHLLFEAITNSAPVSPEAAAVVTEHGELTPTQRIELYADMYWLRMRDTLRDAFKNVEDAQIADFLREHGSNHFSLDQVGAAFAQFLGTPEAALEWARSESFVSLDAPTIGFDALQTIPSEEWGDVVPVLHPAVRVLKTHVVWRSGFEVFQAPLTDAEHDALCAARGGASLGDVLAPYGEDAGAAFEALRSWFNEGMVSRLQRAAARERAD